MSDRVRGGASDRLKQGGTAYLTTRLCSDLLRGRVFAIMRLAG